MGSFILLMNVDGFTISVGSWADIEQSTFHFHDLKYRHTENTNFGEMWCHSGNKEGGSDYMKETQKNSN
jgi:hypothetical protein